MPRENAPFYNDDAEDMEARARAIRAKGAPPGPGNRAAMAGYPGTGRGGMMTAVPGRDVPRFLALYKDGRLPVDRLRSGFPSLEDINTGFNRLADGDVVRQMPAFSH